MQKNLIQFFKLFVTLQSQDRPQPWKDYKTNLDPKEWKKSISPSKYLHALRTLSSTIEKSDTKLSSEDEIVWCNLHDKHYQPIDISSYVSSPCVIWSANKKALSMPNRFIFILSRKKSLCNSFLFILLAFQFN